MASFAATLGPIEALVLVYVKEHGVVNVTPHTLWITFMFMCQETSRVSSGKKTRATKTNSSVHGTGITWSPLSSATSVTFRF
jgi:hypothetical protein